MGTSKFYAIISPNQKSNIVKTWKECQEHTKGISNILFKSFKTEIEALHWIKEKSNNISTNTKDPITNTPVKITLPSPSDKIIIYVDGSFMPSKSLYAGWGWIAVQKNIVLDKNHGKTPTPALSRNIDGEIFGTLKALEWCQQTKLKEIIIAHDYTGIAAWAKGLWKANSNIAQYYVKGLRKFHPLHINFLKVKAHDGNFWNEKADYLAKKSLL